MNVEDLLKPLLKGLNFDLLQLWDHLSLNIRMVISNNPYILCNNINNTSLNLSNDNNLSLNSINYEKY